MRSVLVTGGLGFVMGNVVRSLAAAWPDARILVLDLAADDKAGLSFFADCRDRLSLFKGDVRDEKLLQSISPEAPITHVIHGATITHHADTERNDPRRYLDVNLGGTVSLLEWSKTLKRLERFLYVSTGGVYGDPTELSPKASQPESGPFDPPEFYAISKYAAELAVRRYAKLYGLPACRVRLSDIFGPMERPTGARLTMSLPYLMMRSVLESRPLRVADGSLEGGGDYLSADEVAEAVRLLLSSSLRYDVFNIASGQRLPLPEIFEAMSAVEPQFRYQVVPPGESEVRFDPTKRLARYNAYSVDRLKGLGWRVRPLRDQLASYREWVMRNPEVRCPRLGL